MMNGLIDVIRRSLTRVLETQEFKNFAQKEQLKDDDWILLDNSFLLRKDLNLTTRKNDLYLSFKVKKSEEQYRIGDIKVTRPKQDLKASFRKLYGDQRGDQFDLSKSVQGQLETFGSIVTCLIGQIYEEPTRVSIDHRRFKALVLDPESEQDVVVSEPEIRISELRSVASHWPQIEKTLAAMGIEDKDIASLANPFDAAYKRLREQHHEKIRLPRTSHDLEAGDTVLSRIVRSIDEAIQSYKKELKEFLESDEENAYHEVLRISYNFAEALRELLRLIVGVCDVKPILFWLTCGEQMKLYEVFMRDLPRHQLGKKPSLKNYRDTISNARNYRFHKLLAVPSDLLVDLEGVSVSARSLRLFTEYKSNSSKNTITFDFDDREIVELLTSLRRTPEQEAPREWWEANLRVMEATLELVRAFERALIETTRLALSEARQAA